jgi:hypothetical protein
MPTFDGSPASGNTSYATLAEVKDGDVLFFTDTSHDTILESTIEAVSRAIDNYCKRPFSFAVATRYYTSQMSDLIFVDDIATASGLALYTDNDGDRTYETTWVSTDYDLLPINAVTNGAPYNMIGIAPEGRYTFPGTVKGIKVTATFGWAAVPAPINRACVMQSVRIWQRYKTMLGVTGTTMLGTMTVKVPEFDADVCKFLDPYVVWL